MWWKTSLTATLTLRNNGSVPVNMPKISLKMVQPQSNVVCLVKFWKCPKRREVDADLYFQQLERVHEILRPRYPASVNLNRVLLQQNNAKPQTARSTLTNIQELGGMELLPHPAYSPDLESSNYHLFQPMAHFLCGRNFENIEAVEVGLTEFFA